ncbi:MAG: cytochrome C oxidase Cbb3 [Planctomyces sp.]|nr:cytochrome C oxidase Cbb3 [Planctomyces sp.]MBA4120610.1 cytochrome C oxidase Cbb3 [Isosphaera sp.]
MAPVGSSVTGIGHGQPQRTGLEGSDAGPAPHALAGDALPGMDAFEYDDAIVRKFVLATIVWGAVAFLVGLVIAVQLAWPAANLGLEWFSFGRLRPLHTNAAIFAFAGNSIFAAIYYSTQRLCRARMFSDALSRLHFWGWQGVIVSAALTLPMGVTQAKEYAELEWPIDLAIAVVWVGFFGVNFFGTLMRRRERHMYVALWFYIATIVTVAVLHVFNNLWVPLAAVELLNGRVPSGADWLKSWPIYAGVQDAFMQWWYGHNAVAFFLTTPFLGLMYYFLPKAAEKPVYSYRLSIVHFWSLVFIYIWAGPHHLHYTALPAWASTLGMIFSLMLWMPSWGGMINGLLTLRGAWGKVTSDPILKFFVVGVTFYGMSTFEGPVLSIKSVNALTHYTDWTIAHVHGGALGWNGFMTFGMLYWLMPRLFQAPLWSGRLMGLHFWVATLGILLYVGSIYTAGLTQGLMWRAFDQTGALAYPEFIETVTVLIPMYWIRVVGGALYLAGMVMLIVNAAMTYRSRPARYARRVQHALPLSAAYADPPRPRSRLDANIGAARWLDSAVVSGWFHRVWERKPARFTVLTTAAVVVASLFEIVPTFLIRSNVPSIASVQPYTPLELIGRDIYIAEGCYNCHSQMIRPLWADVKRYSEQHSLPGESVYDRPFQWGSRRIGPDLAREGGRQSHDWQVSHLENPRSLVAESIMPSYAHLLEQDLNFDSIKGRVQAMALLGVPYGPAVKGDNAKTMALEQASRLGGELAQQGRHSGLEGKKVIALLAYLQRLGTDVFKPAPEEPAGEAGAPDKGANP